MLEHNYFYKIPKFVKYFIVVCFVLLIALGSGFLTTTGHINILLLTIFGIFLLFISFLKSDYLLYYYLILGGFVLPNNFGRIGGLVTLNWAWTAFLAVIYFWYSLLLFQNFSYVISFKESRILILAIFPFVIFVGISILWSFSPMISMRYYPKYIMSAFLSLALLLNKRISSYQAIKMLMIGGLVFFIVSIAWELLRDFAFGYSNPYFEGISGRHYAKWYVEYIAIFSLCMLISGIGKKFPILLMGIGLIVLGWILQRGALMAFIVGIITVYFLSLRRFSLSSLVTGFAIIMMSLLIIYTLFYVPRFQQYMFYSDSQADLFFKYMNEGDIGSAFNEINWKGRLEQWAIIEENFPITALGAGFGTIAAYFKETNSTFGELHNDVKQFRIELGYIGFSFYILMWILLFYLGCKLRKSKDKVLKGLAISLCAYTVSLFVWSFVDHTFSYMHVSGAYMFMLGALVVKRVQEIESEMQESI